MLSRLMSKLILLNVGFEVFMAVTMKNAIFWDVGPCEFNINRHFGGTCCLHRQGIRNNSSKEKS
jgi:hypothetical protein